jgi:iron complex outermembrane receptor protein
VKTACAIALLAPLLAFAQQSEEPTIHKDVVIVTGTFAPVPLEEADRAIDVLPLPDPTRLLILTPFEQLRTDPSIDVRSRAPNGVQSDISIRGASFGQTLVLIDGIRFNDAQSGHHNFDLPLPLDMIDRLEALKGAGSMFYGSDAIGGVVNVIPRKPEATEVRFRAGVGNFGTNVESGTLATASSRWTEQLSFERDFSTGFRFDRDYRNLSLASTTTLVTAAGTTRLLLATNDRPFGADQFYGNYPSWERTRGWFAGLRQDIGERMEATFAYRRHTDLYVLYRDRPEVFTNRHADDSWQAAFRRHDPIGGSARIYYGAEG